VNKSFQTFTPRVRPLEYDAIEGRTGCEPESGNTFYGLKAFTELCIALHDSSSPVFGRPATVSYALGPYYKGIPQFPYTSVWAAWVATEGVRVGKFSHVVPPANTTGEPSNLYPTTKPTQITHGWNAEGMLAIAIQKTPTTIELKRYDDTSETVSTFNWNGVSPALFYAALVVKNPPTPGGLVCYYLNPDSPKVVYARFEADNFATERIIMPEVRVPLARLIGTTSHGAKLVLYALDDQGRDVTLTTPVHPPAPHEAMSLDVTFVDGAVLFLAVDGGTFDEDAATLDISAPFGQVLHPLIDPGEPLPEGKMSLSVALIGGEVV
jgi:hypothetical protein